MSNIMMVVAVAVGLLAAGCGKNDPSTNANTFPPPITNQQNQVAPTYTSIGNQTLCSTTYGFKDTSGRTICETTVYLGSSVNILTPNSTYGFYSYQSSIPIRAGDTVSISSVKGSWGFNGVANKTYWGGFLNVSTWTNNCDAVSAKGIKDGQQLVNDGQKAGLMAGVGTDIFYIGDGISAHTATSDGFLRIGFNIPLQDQINGLCGYWSLSAHVKHCQDASGNTVSCQ